MGTYWNIFLCVLILTMTWLPKTGGSTKWPQHESPHCTSTFHVWQLGPDAQTRFWEMGVKFDNLTAFTQMELAELRSHIGQEVNRINNWTFAMDKRLFQMQIQEMDEELLQMKHLTGNSKLQAEFKHVVGRVADLERSVLSLRTKLRTHQSPERYENRPQQQGVNTDLGRELQNSVGNLKSEWLLLKRDVESLKKEARRFKESQDHVMNDTTKLKADLDYGMSDIRILEMKAQEIESANGRLDEKLDAVAAELEKLRRLFNEHTEKLNSQKASMTSLLETTNRLQRELGDVHIKLASPEHVILHSARTTNHPDINVAASENDVLIEQEQDITSESENSRKEEKQWPKDCQEVYASGLRISGVYEILPHTARYLVPVYCHMINDTGYTVVQRRVDGTLSFNRRWLEYKHGFGNPYGEFWAGNDLLHQMTMQKPYTLRVDMWDWDGQQFYAEYTRFYVEGEKDQYKLRVGGYTGNAGDSLTAHNDMAFSTEDMDNDLHRDHCAAQYKAGWWYDKCFFSQLNGFYHTAWYSRSQSNIANGIVWFTLKDTEFYSLQKVEMKLKPNDP